jgi:BolA protein
MTMQNILEDKLAAAIDLQHLEVINESANHNVPPGSESHFKVILVSSTFENMALLSRHRRVNDVLRDELAGSIHALAIHAYTPEEWRQRHGDAPLSPPCMGGEKKD